jgi:uncharacterized protein YbaA (DUF1428 family)
MPTYVDGFVLTVPKKKLREYQKMAAEAGKFWRKLGALDYKECVQDDLYPKGGGGMVPLRFPEMVKPRKGELILFSYIVYKSRAHRDAVNRKVMAEMKKAMKDPKHKDQPMPFDVKRMAYGGFKVIVG